MDKEWVMLGQRFCDIKKHGDSIFDDRIKLKYGKSHAFSKKIYKMADHLDLIRKLASYLDELVCNSYPMDVQKIDGILLTHVFYNNYNDFEYEKPYKFDRNRHYTNTELRKIKHQNTITQNDFDFIQDWINKFKIFIEYLLNDFEKEFNINKDNEDLIGIKKECKKINKYIVSLQNMLELQTIDNYPLI